MDRLMSRYKNIKTIRLDDNYGFSKANNIAVEQSKGEFICLVNPDVIVGEEVFEKSIAFYENNELNTDIGFCGIQLVDGSGTFLPESKRRIPKPLSALGKLLGYSGAYYDNRILKDQDAPTEVLVGAFMLAKKSVYQECGGLDERYFMYGEDIDLSYTALKAGYQNYYLGSLSAIHFKGESTVKDKASQQLFYSAMILFFKKHYPRAKFLSQFLSYMLPRITLSRKRTYLEDSATNPSLICVTEDSSFEPSWAEEKVPLGVLKTNEKAKARFIVDCASLSFKEVIQTIKESAGAFKTYRFLTQDRSAYAGSDTSENKGEVKKF
ncbi:glycosyl transferase, group 2 family protein [Nonlabens marinus S1-08]|uniref:Glycosyl transferase, group 2 family protein n=2 Tax=Nonlabens TaxID=363408 RepID=W8W009_9FLAO|nr:glycosyl transferase, group 2 family protein [Nonlabens marinus S1-08]